MNLQNFKYPIILVILIGLGFLAYNWHSDSIDAAKREAIALYEGKNIIFKQQDSTLKELLKSQQVEINKLKTSANQSIHDTVKIYSTYNANSNKIKHLGLDSSISFLSNRLK